jgi:hypothetical protein
MTAQPPNGPPAGPPAEPGSGSGSGTDPGAYTVPGEAPFDPYRFGAPAHPIDPAYAPPGYVPPAPTPPAGPSYGGYGGQQFPGQPDYSNQPGYPGQTGYPGQPGPSGYPGQPSQPGYPPAGYAPPGAPAPYGYPTPNPYGPQRTSNGLAVTALVLGIAAFVFSWIPFFDAVLIVPGIVFGFVGLSAAKRRAGLGRGLAIAGLCLSLVAAAICIAWSSYVAVNIHCNTVDDGFGDTSSHCGFNQDDN